LNVDQLPDWVDDPHRQRDDILKWMKEAEGYDVCICDCCGDTEGWYGIPGEHYGPMDPRGPSGPYAYNGGLCECN